LKVYLYIFLFSILCLSLTAKLKEGVYRGVLVLSEDDNIELPFNFDIQYKKRKAIMIIRNGDEKIIVNEIIQKKDSFIIQMPVFDTEFRCKKNGNDLEGVWINHYRKNKNIIRFYAKHNESNRFDLLPGKSNPIFQGRWEVNFSPGTADSSKAVGIFKHIEQTDLVNGTFLTETGDYRFLEGMRKDDKLFLSCFDGSHAFLFTASLREDQLRGVFYSGSHWKEPWNATKNAEFKLRESSEITFVKNKEEKIGFSFQDLNKKLVSLSDKRFENKAVIIQIMGSWCPNCMDETIYLNSLYINYQSEGLEIIALAFEKTEDPEKARRQVKRMTERLKVLYPVLLTFQTGKEKATKTFPYLNKISAFPTTLFLNKQHQIVKIHTGFSGPATGNDYLSFKESTEALIKQLIKE
jgi:thiol-disulfide isomerase/thioredoxin